MQPRTSSSYGEFGEPRLSFRDQANVAIMCGEVPAINGMPGCGARDWRVFESPMLDVESGWRLLVCQECGSECGVRFDNARGAGLPTADAAFFDSLWIRRI